MIYQKQEPVHIIKKDTVSASLLLYSNGKIWAINPTCSCNSKSPNLSFMSVFVNYILKNYVTYFLQMENTYLKEDDKGFLLCLPVKRFHESSTNLKQHQIWQKGKLLTMKKSEETNYQFIFSKHQGKSYSNLYPKLR